MRTSLAITLSTALSLFTLPSSHAQSSTSSGEGDQTTTLTSTQSSTSTDTITRVASGSVISASSAAASSTSTSVPPAPTGNVTDGVDQSVYLWPPSDGLVMCQRIEFAFTGPAVPKSCGVFVTNGTTYLQQIPLGGAYSSLTAGTFSWLVDIPAGLSLAVQFWVTLNNAIQQYTLPPLIVQDSGDWSCLATGPGQNTQSIISYASQLNESYVYTPPKPPSEAKGGSNAGAIAGGVVGGLAGLALLILGAYYIYRRRTRNLSPPPPDGLDGGEKYYWNEAGVPVYGTPPPAMGTYAQMYAQQYQGGGQQQQAGVVPYQPKNQTAMAMEPMPAPSSPTAPGSPAVGGTASDFGGRHGGTEGLEDPSTFLSRSTMSGSGSGHR
ncbi:hypothetical protein JCM11251_003135 [Rhodosporidiobolus azoricus]